MSVVSVVIRCGGIAHLQHFTLGLRIQYYTSEYLLVFCLRKEYKMICGNIYGVTITMFTLTYHSHISSLKVCVRDVSETCELDPLVESHVCKLVNSLSVATRKLVMRPDTWDKIN